MRRHALVARAYGATAQRVAAFGPLVTAVIAARNGFAAVLQEPFADGAAWIWRLGGELLPEAVWVRARWHLTDARRRALRSALPDKAERARWSARVESLVAFRAAETSETPVGASLVSARWRQNSS